MIDPKKKVHFKGKPLNPITFDSEVESYVKKGGSLTSEQIEEAVTKRNLQIHFITLEQLLNEAESAVSLSKKLLTC